MTSTQVQRTLVKSAPEIWAELSDPAALARHLDPVGEIRITRAEPEQKVEWEAAEARGTVLIKPSGWGTRVTLTMSRDEREDASQAGQATTPGEPAPQAVVGSEPQTTTEPAPEAPGASEPQTTTEPAAQAAGADQPDGEPGPAATADPAGTPQPRTALEPSGKPEPGPALEPTGMQEQLESEAPPHRLELLPRRGFLARLVGRRRRAARQPSSTGSSFHGLAVQGPGVGPWPTASAEWVDQFPRREPDSELAPAVAEPEPSLEDTLADRELPEEDHAAGVEEMAPGAEDPAAGVEDVAPGAEDPAAGVEDVAPGAEDPAVEAQATPAAQHDLAPAEEASSAPAQDAAVLSAVLDRLGAAHHRPFSRA